MTADPTPPSPTQHPGHRQCAACGDDIWPNEPAGDTCAICQVRRRVEALATASRRRDEDQPGARDEYLPALGASARDVPALLAEVERLTAHSTTLNSISWRMAEALGRVPDGATAVAGNPEEQLSALLADLDAARQDAEQREQLLDRNAAGWHQALRDLDAAREALRRVEQERDKLRAFVDGSNHPVDHILELIAERDRMRPVVEAARALCKTMKEIDDDEWGDEPALSVGSAFAAAVDTYETQEGTE